MSANRLLSLPAPQPPYSPRLVQQTYSISQDGSNHIIVSRTWFGQQTEFRAMDSTGRRALSL
eukprot:9273107-Pyramimonas_sp.AAC.1